MTNVLFIYFLLVDGRGTSTAACRIEAADVSG